MEREAGDGESSNEVSLGRHVARLFIMSKETVVENFSGKGRACLDTNATLL